MAYITQLNSKTHKGAITFAAHCHRVNVLLTRPNNTFLFLLFWLCDVGRVAITDF